VPLEAAHAIASALDAHRQLARQREHAVARQQLHAVAQALVHQRVDEQRAQKRIAHAPHAAPPVHVSVEQRHRRTERREQVHRVAGALLVDGARRVAHEQRRNGAPRRLHERRARRHERNRRSARRRRSQSYAPHASRVLSGELAQLALELADNALTAGRRDAVHRKLRAQHSAEQSVSATRRSTQKLRDANSWRASLAAADTAAASIAEPSLRRSARKRRGECTNVAQRAQCFISTSLART
jgi:hypothetical protein